WAEVTLFGTADGQVESMKAEGSTAGGTSDKPARWRVSNVSSDFGIKTTIDLGHDMTGSRSTRPACRWTTRRATPMAASGPTKGKKGIGQAQTVGSARVRKSDFVQRQTRGDLNDRYRGNADGGYVGHTG